jgi:hypothetical protein
LLNYISSDHTTKRIGLKNVGHILNFLRGHVFVHEEYFASYKYNQHRSFLEYSNTPLEGTNGGLKYGYFAVQPHMKISTSASYMICQDEYRHTEQKRTAHTNSCNTRLYNLNADGTKDTNRIVPKAVGEMQKQITLAGTYCSLRIDDMTWLVRTGKDDSIGQTTRLIPVFCRVRKVLRLEHGGFECSCPFTSMFGIPCRHIAHILLCYSLERYVFDHHDVDMRWWTTYADFVAIKTPSSLNDAEAEIKARLIYARQNHNLLKIGKKAKIENFSMKTFACGQAVGCDVSGFSPMTATRELFSDIASYPSNYDHNQVDQAVLDLNSTYSGIKVTFCGGEDDSDVSEGGGDDVGLGGGGDDCELGEVGGGGDENFTINNSATRIDYSDRIVTVDEGASAGGSRFLEMKNPIKELFGFLENCDEEFYTKYKEEFEDQLSRARQNVISHQKKKDQTKGRILSCLPTNVLNTERTHKKQQVHF